MELKNISNSINESKTQMSGESKERFNVIVVLCFPGDCAALQYVYGEINHFTPQALFTRKLLLVFRQVSIDNGFNRKRLLIFARAQNSCETCPCDEREHLLNIFTSHTLNLNFKYCVTLLNQLEEADMGLCMSQYLTLI